MWGQSEEFMTKESVAVLKAFAKLSIHRDPLKLRFPQGPATLDDATEIILSLEDMRDRVLDDLAEALKE